MSHTSRRALALSLLAAALLLPADVRIPAQSRPALDVAESGRWETLVAAEPRLGLSPDGQVVTYRIDRSNWDDEMRVTRVADGRTFVVPYGRDPQYAANGRSLLYTIGQATGARSRGDTADGLGLLDLTTFTEARIAGVDDYAVSADGAFLATVRAVPRTGTGRGNRRDAERTRLYVRALGSATETPYDDVTEFEWSKDGGHRLALLQAGTRPRATLVDPATGAATVLDEGAVTYSRIAWRATMPEVAILRGQSDGSRNGFTYDVVAVRLDRPAPVRREYVAARDRTRAAGVRIGDGRALEWTADGRFLYVGLDTGATESREKDAVEIWHWRDVVVKPIETANDSGHAARAPRAAVDLDRGALMALEPAPGSRSTPMGDAARAWVADGTPYAMARTLGRPAADVSVVDLATGTTRPVATAIDESDIAVRRDGGALLFTRDNHLWSFDALTGARTDLTAASGGEFFDTTSDLTTPHLPLHGIGGWTTDGAALVYDRHDVWRVPVDGRGAVRLTSGAADGLRYRLVRLDGLDGPIDLAAAVYFSLFGERTKQSGYARRMPTGTVERLRLEDRAIDGLSRAARADVYAFVSQAFDVSPNIFVAGPRLDTARAVTATNPQQAQFAWGRSTVIDFTTARGDALQAALYYPANFVAGRRYPAIVKLYERLSDEVHRYDAPSDMDEANIAVFTNLGYVVIAPDIRYRPRDPGGSTVAAVTAAIARTDAMGVIDPRRVGAIGHSWGAYGSAYLATRTNGLLAAAVAGAPITDLISQYGDHHWGTGVAETDHIETGQQRMQVPYWEDPQAYMDNSPVFGVGGMTTPLLLEAGDDDGEVFWHQSVELYNAARRAGKPVVLLVYPGEDHVLDRFEFRRDYQRRLLEWFGHYLKGEPAAAWMNGPTSPR